MTARPAPALAELEAQHAAGHGPSALCGGPDRCTSARYLALIAAQQADLARLRETLRAIWQCRLNNGNGTICRSCWEQAERGRRG